MRQVILASASPRRQVLLRYVIDCFDVLPSKIEEIAHGTPQERVEKLAYDKAMDIARRNPEAVVIGADTLVVIGNRIFGKPQNAQEAADMLSELSSKTHQVYTGLAVIADDTVIVESVCTDVTFNALSANEIDAYIETGEPMDKAGAYGIQGYGGKYIKKIDGCYFNVMGLPQSVLYNMLKKIDLK